MRRRSIRMCIVVLLSAMALQTAHAQDRPRRDGELTALLQLNCRDKAHERRFQSALESTASGSLRRAEVLVLYAHCLSHAKQRASDAVPLVQEAARILPANAGVQRHLGYAYFRVGKDLAAIEAFERSLELEPDADTYDQLGFSLMRAASGPLVYSNPDLFNEYMARAEEQFRRAMSLSPENPIFHSQLGACLIGRGKQEEGIGELHRAIELSHTFKEWESPAARAFALAELNLELGQESGGRTADESGGRTGAE